MKIVLLGGLGNQLFQITSTHLINDCNPIICQPYLNVSQRRDFNELVPFLCNYNSRFSIQENTLNYLQRKVINLSIRVSSRINPNQIDIADKILVKALEILNDVLVERTVKTYLSMGAVPKEFPKPSSNLRIIGYLQTAFLLEHKECTCGFIESLFNFLNQNTSEEGFGNGLAIHVRLGDYENNETFALLEMDYYKRALKKIRLNFPPPEIELYSNDIEKSLKLLNGIGVQEVSIPTTSTDSGLTVIQSLTNHSFFIIANSTLSWWGAYVSHSRQKIVIAPRSWFGDSRPDENLFPKSWIRL